MTMNPPAAETLPAAFALQAAAGPDRPALIIPEAARTISFGEAARIVDRYAAALGALGVKKGDRVAVRLEKSAEGLLLFFAVLKVGAIHVPVNPGFTAREAGVLIEESAPALLIDNAPEALGAYAETVRLRRGFLTGDADDLLSVPVAAAAPAVEPGPEDHAAMLFTSGTTGRPKGAPLTHRNLMSNTAALAEAWGFTAADVVLHVLPVFHAHGLFLAAIMPLIHGAAVIVTPKFDAAETIRLLPEASVLMAVPAIYTRLLAQDGFTPEACRNLRLATSGSAPLSPETFAALKARTGLSVVERYGLTETSILTTNPGDGTARVGSVGRPLPIVELRIADEAGAPLPAGEVGRVQARGPAIIAGYWNRPEQKGDWTGDGFFDTGDMGRLDADGFLWLVGRKKDLIISGGFNVYPREVETVIETAPGVLEAVVFGAPHPDFGEGVVAAVKCDPAAPAPEAAVQAVIARDLTRYKQPKKIVFVEEFPRNAMGKVLKAALRETYENVFAPKA